MFRQISFVFLVILRNLVPESELFYLVARLRGKMTEDVPFALGDCSFINIFVFSPVLEAGQFRVAVAPDAIPYGAIAKPSVVIY